MKWDDGSCRSAAEIYIREAVKRISHPITPMASENQTHLPKYTPGKASRVSWNISGLSCEYASCLAVWIHVLLHKVITCAWVRTDRGGWIKTCHHDGEFMLRTSRFQTFINPTRIVWRPLHYEHVPITFQVDGSNHGL